MLDKEKQKRKITKTTNWLTKGITQDELKKIKEEALREYAEEIAQIKRQEKINEMAGDMQYGCVKHDLWPDDAKEIAKALIILGYQKIDKDKEVVLSKEDYQLWNILKKTWASNDKEVSAKDMLETLKNTKELGSKEAATKFYDKFNESISCFELDKNVSEDYKEGYAQAIADICGKLDETAVELGVDLKEYYGK